MSPVPEKHLEQVVASLRQALGQNLFSCCVYGSVVRGNYVPGKSDINLLIVLEMSDAAAHESIAGLMVAEEAIDPFVIARGALGRTAQAFASKFASIKNNYRVLHGADPLADIRIDPAQQRFLCEQALRNLQLRLTYAFVVRHRTKAYRRFVLRSATAMFIQLSEVLRLEGVAVPKEFESRIPLLEKQFQVNGDVLRELWQCKSDSRAGATKSDESWHERLMPLLDAVLGWVIRNWQTK